MANVVLAGTFEVIGFGSLLPGGSHLYATGLTAAQARAVADRRQAASDEVGEDAVWLVVASVVTDEPFDADLEAGLDDWEGPESLGYSESDPEAFDEMVRDDMAGRF
jgi:hypothetical protein